MNYKVIKNIWETKSYFYLLLFVFSILAIVTIVLQLNVIPTMKKMAFDSILDESKKISHYMSKHTDYTNETKENIDKKLYPLIEAFSIYKIHYFNKDGKITYSTVKEKVGYINNHHYFTNIVGKGKPYYSIKLKGINSLEDGIIEKSIVEIYVPIMENNVFIGAFELYYDISPKVEEFNNYSNLILKLNILIVFLIFILFSILLYLISNKSLKEKELISKDYLTNLYNRRYFYKIVKKYINLANRNKTPISICIIDIDNFKHINDTYGHNIGDETLKTFSSEIKGIIRESDVLVRFGGEEFLILLPNTNISNTEILGNKICKHFELLKNDISFTVSIGISEYNDKQQIDETINIADKALYIAKTKGKNRVVVG